MYGETKLFLIFSLALSGQVLIFIVIQMLALWKIVRAVVILIATVFLFSCQKKWKETTQLDVSVKYDPTTAIEGFTISSIAVDLEKIRFSGTRKQGGDVVFESHPGGPAQVLNASGMRALSCDLPQGDYTRILLDVSLSSPDTSPTITINASFTDSEGVNNAVVIKLSTAVYAESVVKNTSGGNEVTVRTGKTSSIMITLSPAYWLQNVDGDVFESADCSQGGGTPVIYVDKNNNTDIYQKIISRLNVPPVITMQ